MKRKSLGVLLGLLALASVFSAQLSHAVQAPTPQESTPIPPR